jgi:hypothetical protein
MEPNPLFPSRLGALAPILRHTPAWVWLLLAGLVLLGWLYSRTRTVKLAQVSAVPVGMTVFSLWGVVNAFARSPLQAGVILLWLLAAVAVAVPLSQRRPAAWYDRASRSFDLPGSWIPMLLFVGIFLTRYVVSVQLVLHPALVADAGFALPVAAVYGAFTGVFIGRAGQLWRLALDRAPRAVAA